MTVITVPPPLRKIAPLVLPQSLVDAVEQTAVSMRSPMVPQVSFAWGARELITRGCAAFEAALAAGKAPTWALPDPPRGHRRRKGAPAVRKVEVAYVRIAPMALPEPLLDRLESLRVRYTETARRPLSFAKLVREAIYAGFAVREEERRRAEEHAEMHAAILRSMGVPDPKSIVAVAVPVVSPYAPPGRRKSSDAAWATPPVRSRARAVKKQDGQKVRRPARTRARATRRRTPARRASRGDEDGDGGGDGDGAGPTSGSAGAPDGEPLTEAERRFVEFLVEQAVRQWMQGD